MSWLALSRANVVVGGDVSSQWNERLSFGSDDKIIKSIKVHFMVMKRLLRMNKTILKQRQLNQNSLRFSRISLGVPKMFHKFVCLWLSGRVLDFEK